VHLTYQVAEIVAYVLKEIVKSDPDALVDIKDEEDNSLYTNYSEWIKIHD
jgi:hypothetical protein